jgi:hypothetical protein
MYHRKDHTHFSHFSELNRDQVAQFLQAKLNQHPGTKIDKYGSSSSLSGNRRVNTT